MGVSCAAGEAAEDIQQVWANCVAFNEPGSDIAVTGEAAEVRPYSAVKLCRPGGLSRPQIWSPACCVAVHLTLNPETGSPRGRLCTSRRRWQPASLPRGCRHRQKRQRRPASAAVRSRRASGGARHWPQVPVSPIAQRLSGSRSASDGEQRTQKRSLGLTLAAAALAAAAGGIGSTTPLQQRLMAAR